MGFYLFCYQEVIAESFSCADGSQEEDKDQIQEPPAKQNYYQQLHSHYKQEQSDRTTEQVKVG